MPSVQRLTARQVSVRVIHLLMKVQIRFGKMEHPPVDLDNILKFLGLRLEFDDIFALTGMAGHLGFTSVEERAIFVDQSLDPVDHPEMEGRLNFTIGHEIGHWQLHRGIPNPHSLPDNDKRWLERQADWFASYLLMPTWLVKNEWQAKFENSRLVITPEMEQTGIENFGSKPAAIAAFADYHAGELAPLFKVSQEAMRIRLQELGLVPRH